MIHENTISAVYPLAEKLAGKKIRLTPIESTPLAELIQAGSLAVPKSTGEEDKLSIEQQILKGSTFVGVDGFVDHDTVMEEVVVVASETVRNNLKLARTVVNPIVGDVAEQTRQYINDSLSAAQDMVSVVPFFYHEIWDSPQIVGLMERYAETAKQNIQTYFSVPQGGDEEWLRDLAKTGSASFDSDVDSLFDSLADGQAEKIYDTVFGREKQFINELNSYVYPADVLNDPQMPTKVILTHLWSRGLVDNPPDGVNIDLASYRNFMVNVMAQTGRIMNELMRRRDRAQRQGQLIQSYPPTVDDRLSREAKIMVNGDVYKRFLDDGGESSVILGAYVTDKERGYQTLLDNSEKYIAAWQRRVTVFEGALRYKRFNYAVEGVRLAVRNIINDMDDDELAVSREKILSCLDTEISKLPNDFHEDLYWWCRRVVCGAMFAHTMALTILETLDQEGDSDEFLKDKPRDAAFLATIAVVTDWTAAMINQEETAFS